MDEEEPGEPVTAEERERLRALYSGPASWDVLGPDGRPAGLYRDAEATRDDARLILRLLDEVERLCAMRAAICG